MKYELFNNNPEHAVILTADLQRLTDCRLIVRSIHDPFAPLFETDGATWRVTYEPGDECVGVCDPMHVPILTDEARALLEKHVYRHDGEQP